MNSEWAVLAETKANVGEGPIWIARDETVLWVDIFGQALHRLSLHDNCLTSQGFDEPIGWVVERRGLTDLIVGLKSGLHFLCRAPFNLEPVPRQDPLAVDQRLNDAKVDPAGRLWFGTMHDRGEVACGGLRSINAEFDVVVHDEQYFVPNGPAFSPDGNWLYHADSKRRSVYRYAVDELGNAHDRRIFTVFENDDGYPDGMTVDREGCIWIAHWDGGCLSRFDPDGRRIERRKLPVSRVTSCCFGGADLDRLFVTSASRDGRREPLAGALFELDPRVRGWPPTPFDG